MTRYAEAIGNTLNKKRIIRKVLPKEHKPFICIYPRGNFSQKIKGMKVLGAHHSVEDLINTVSSMLPDTLEFIQTDNFESRIVKDLHDRKLSL